MNERSYGRVLRRVPTFSISLERVSRPAPFAWRVTVVDVIVWLGAAAICGMAVLVIGASLAGFFGGMP